MPEISDEKFSAILSVVKKAKSDNEMFAALLVVSKLTKGDSLSIRKRRETLNTIGIPFPLRLVKTSCLDSTNNNKYTFASIGVSIIWSFCADANFFEKDIPVTIIPHLLKVLERFPEEENVAIVNDCLECLLSLSQIDKYVCKLIESGTIAVLCSCEELFYNKCISVISVLLSKQPGLWDTQHLQKWFKSLANDFKTDQTAKKFTICGHLLDLLILCSDKYYLKNFEESVTDIVFSLEEILCSKLTADQRKMPLQLVSEIIRLFGTRWLILRSRKENFVVIVTRLACIEVGLYLRNILDSKEQQKSCISLIAPCFSISETICSVIARFEQNDSGKDDILSFEQIRLTQPALADLANSVEKYISFCVSEQSIENKNTDLFNEVLPLSMRFITSWLNIENNVTSAQGIETLALLPEILQYTLNSANLELLKCTLAAVMQAAYSTETHGTMIKNEILKSLTGIVEFIANDITNPLSFNEILETFHLVLQVLISVTSRMTKNECQDYHKDMDELLTNMKTYVTQQSFTCQTVGYLYPLLVILLNKSFKTICEDTLNKIFNFLFDAYEISDGELKVTSGYQEFWQEIFPLWQLCMKETTHYIGKNLSAKETLLQNNHIVSLTKLFDGATVGNDPELTGILFHFLDICR